MALIYIINPFFCLCSRHCFFQHFTQHSFAKKCTLLRRTIIWEILFPLFLLLHFLFYKPIPITYFEGRNAPVTLLGHDPWFYKGKGDGWWLATTVYDSPTGPFQLPTFEIIQHLHLLEVVVVRRKKLLGRSQHLRIFILNVLLPMACEWFINWKCW